MEGDYIFKYIKGDKTLEETIWAENKHQAFRLFEGTVNYDLLWSVKLGRAYVYIID